jgi:hypothetical protein
MCILTEEFVMNKKKFLENSIPLKDATEIEEHENLDLQSKVYFAHNIRDYNTDLEKRAIAFLTDEFNNVENPNQPHHQKAYATQKMHHFIKDVIPKCTALAYMPCSNGKIGAGVFLEIETAAKLGMPVFRLSRDLEYFQEIESIEEEIMTIEETRDFNAG